MSDLRYAVIGCGAIGGFYGGKLAQAGMDVHFLFHNDYDYVAQHGLRVDSVEGDFLLEDIQAYRDTKDMPVCDVVIVCLKTTANHLLPVMLPPIVGPDTCIILIQNGLGMEDELAAVFPDNDIAGVMAFICSNKIGPGHINHLDYGKLTVANRGKTPPACMERLEHDFSVAGIPLVTAGDLLTARWKKLVWNIPYNGLTVVLHAQTDKLMAQNDTRQLLSELMAEVIEAGNACGAQIPALFAGAMLESTDSMKPYSPSMLLDYENHRPMEIHYMYENPIRQAAAAGYSMKKTKVLKHLLGFIDEGNKRGI